METPSRKLIRSCDLRCCSAEALLASLGNESIDLIVIDPPYVTTREAWDTQDVITSHLCQEFRRVLKPTGNLYCWCGIGEKSQSLIRWFPLFAEHLHFKDLITWKKRRGIGMRKGWLYTREECMWFVKDNKKFRWNTEAQYSSSELNEFKKGMSGTAVHPYKRLTNVWTDIPETLTGKVKGHYTAKQVELITRLVRTATLPGDTVLDCFMGSGTTGIAALAEGCHFIGCDINNEFVELAKTRIQITTNDYR